MHAVTAMGNCRIYLKSFVLDIHSSGASTSSVVAFDEEGAITTKKYSIFALTSIRKLKVSLATKLEIAFFFYRMPDSCIVFGCNDKSDSENGKALHRKPFINHHCSK